MKVQKYVKSKRKLEISQLKISGFIGAGNGIRTRDSLLGKQNNVKIAYKITYRKNNKRKYASNLFDAKCN